MRPFSETIGSVEKDHLYVHLTCWLLMIVLLIKLGDRYTGCVGGCDDNLRELLDLKDLTRLPSESGKSSIHTMFLLYVKEAIVSPD